jgi:hypothetical protein
MGGCVWWAKGKIETAKSEMEKTPEGRVAMNAMKDGASKGQGGFIGAMTGLAGASIGMTSGALAVQVLPSLTVAEQKEAKEVFKAFAEKGASMKKEDFEAYSEAVKRFTEATDPGRKAKQEALEKEIDPSKKMQLGMEMMKVEPEHARRLVADLKVITNRL